MFTSQISQAAVVYIIQSQHKSRNMALIPISWHLWLSVNVEVENFPTYSLQISVKDYNLVTLFIQGTKAETLVQTPGESLAPQPYPQEVTPYTTQLSPDRTHMSGPPLSPWQLSTRLCSCRFPAQSILPVNRPL